MVSIAYPESVDVTLATLKSAPAGTEIHAGGTDVNDRAQRHTLAPAALVNIRRVRGLDVVDAGESFVELGARVTLTDIAEHPVLQKRLPGLTGAARHTATPQIRAMATLGGALCQRPRCEYLRHPDFVCAKEGGARCFAREGDHTRHAIFEAFGCIAVHPSTIGAAILSLDGEILVQRLPGVPAEAMPASAFFTVKAKDPTRENALPEGAVVVGVRIPWPKPNTRQTYVRASARKLADWADVEVSAALVVEGGRVTDARIVLGAVSRVPRRATKAERILTSGPLSERLLTQAADAAVDGAVPLENNTYKVDLCQRAVRACLDEVLS